LSPNEAFSKEEQLGQKVAVFQQFTQWLVKAKQERSENRFKFQMLNGGAKTVLEYWSIDGEEFPSLQTIALTVFGMMTSSAASERNFSKMGFVQNKLRNSFGKERVEKLVFLKPNAPLLEFETVYDSIDDEDDDGVEESAANSSVVDVIELE
jgi:hAT family C-terminal dimerisation region